MNVRIRKRERKDRKDRGKAKIFAAIAGSFSEVEPALREIDQRN